MDERNLRRRKEKAFEDKNQEHLAQACSNLGDFLNQHGRYDEAVAEYEHESKIYSKLGRQLEMAKANRMVAEMLMLLSDFDRALKHVLIYLKIVKQLANKVEMQRAYATLGRAHLLQGQIAGDLTTVMRPLKNAEKAFIKSLLICKELSGSISKIELLDMQTRLYLNIGVVREHMEDFEESISYMEKAIKICKDNDLYELLHLCYVSATLLYHYKISDTTMALRFCNLALEVSERLPNRIKKECETLTIKSEIMLQLGDFQSSKQILRKAYKLKSPEINDHQNIEKTLKVVAALCYTLDELVTTNSDDYKARKSLYEKMGDGCCILQIYAKAIDYYLKTLECAQACCESKKELAPIYVSLYQTYKDNKQFDKALEYLWKEFDINKDDPVEAFNTLCNIGEICELESKPFWTIQDCYQKAINEARNIDNAKLEEIALARLIKIQKKFNMFTLMESLKEEATKRGIDLKNIEGDSDSESGPGTEHNTPDIGDDICLDDLTDSNEETEEKVENPRPKRSRNKGITVKRNNKGETQLHQACISGNSELVRRLLEQGHTVNVRDHAGWLPLHEACNHGYRDIVEIILDNGGTAAINDKGGTGCDGITPLYDACSNGYLEVAELLLERGANATLKTDFGDTTLNILDKWRSTVEIDNSEQTQYERVRSKVADQLNKAGMLSKPDVLRSPVTNKERNQNERSLDRLRKLAYESNSDESDNEIPPTRRRSLNTSKEISSDEEAIPSTTSNWKRKSPKVLRENTTSQKSSNAKQEYKSLMESLKHPNRLIVSDTPVVSVKKRGGFLDPDDVDDDWLDEDVRPDRKKRKFLNERTIFGEMNELNSKTTAANTTKENFHEQISFENEDDSQDAFKILLESKGVASKSNKSKMPRSSSLMGANHHPRRQSSLFDNGFCRFQSESPRSVDDYHETEPDSTTSTIVVFQRSPLKESPSAPTVSTVSFKIKVEDEMLLIPVDRKKIDEANIRWLAEEASRRYYNLVGLRPVLRLMTSDGFAFGENDLLNAALDKNMISSKVLEWKISPLSQRYEEMCGQLHLEIDFSVKLALEKNQSNCVLLNDQALTPDITLPIFKALLHQATLRFLDLSNNFIQDEGCKQLGKSLATLKQLKTLNLQGNCISSEGLNSLMGTAMAELEELCLNYNPLGNASVRSLEQICKQSTKLKKLHLSSCQISNFYDFDLRFFDLTDFDISFNELTLLSVKTVLSKLNSCRLQFLNLNFSTSSVNQFGGLFLEFLQSGTCEKFRSIELSRCQLTDLDIYSIVHHLSKATDLDKLNLSENPKLTPLALQYVLENISHVKKIYFQECSLADNGIWDSIHFGSSVKAPELIVLSTSRNNSSDMEDKMRPFWELKHGDRAKTIVQNNFVTFYVNDCDLSL